MSNTVLISGIGGIVLSLVFVAFIGKTKGAERARRQMIIFIISGVIFLALGLMILISGVAGERSIFSLIGIPLLFFGCTCLMIADVHRSIREIRNKIIE